MSETVSVARHLPEHPILKQGTSVNMHMLKQGTKHIQNIEITNPNYNIKLQSTLDISKSK